jgi:hypothetical protein
MFFIAAGSVEVMSPDQNERLSSSADDAAPSRENSVIALLSRPSFFGEMALINPDGHSAISTVRTKGFCETYHLSVDDYATLLRDFDHFRGYVELVAQMRLEGHQRTAKEGEKHTGAKSQRGVPRLLGEVFASNNPYARGLIEQSTASRGSVSTKVSSFRQLIDAVPSSRVSGRLGRIRQRLNMKCTRHEKAPAQQV